MRRPKGAKRWKAIDDQSTAETTEFGHDGVSLTLSSRANSGANLIAAASRPPADVALLASQPLKENVAEAIAGTPSAADRLESEREPQVNLDVTVTDSSGSSFTQTLGVSVADVTEVRFAAFGDYGLNDGTQAVADLVASLNVDFILTTGDNIYDSDPVDDQIGQFYSDYIGNYTGAYGPGSATDRFFPSLGDADYGSAGAGTNASTYLNYFTLPGNERYYDFTMGPVHFFALNSNSQEPDGKNDESVQAQWLQAALASSDAPFKVVYFHHPAFSTSGSSSTMRWPFEQWGATAVFSGHRHNYERILRDDNGDGIVMPYFVTGLGGRSISEFDDPPTEGSAVRYDGDWGTMVVQASAESMTFEFWSVAGGGTLIDSYTIDFVPPNPTDPLFTTGNDAVDFNQITAGSYLGGTQYDALAGNDIVTLPTDAAEASAAGYDAAKTFLGGDGNDTVIGGTLNDAINGGNGNDSLSGGNGSDTLTGGSNADTLHGGAGNDSLNGGSNGDTLSGGLGDDSLDGGSSNDTLDYAAAATGVTVNLAAGTATGEGADTVLNIEHVTGSGSDDSITGNSVVNVLLGGGSNDTLSGGSGNDKLTGGTGIDQLSGDAGHDTLKWDTADSFDGGIGFDTLDANVSSADTIDMRGASFANLERIQTGSGADTVTISLNDVLADTADNQFVADLGSSSPDTLIIDTDGGWSATAPNSTLGPTGVAAGLSVSGMTARTFINGTNTVTIFSNAEVVQQTSSAAALFTANADIVDFNQVVAGSYPAGSQYDALAGNDVVMLPTDAAEASAAGYDPAKTFLGGDGNDSITGGTLNDALNGGNGNDILSGGDGKDVLTGGNNADVLDGGAGNDSLSAGGSADTLKGGLGSDTLDGGSSNDTVDYTNAAAAVTVSLAAGTATGGENDDKLLNIENATGSGFDDAITGNTLANVLLGGGSNDTLGGGDGNDVLTGGAGLDQLSGDAGHDTLKWDSADQFDGGSGFDTLDAILGSADTIDLRGAGFTNLERIQTGSGADTVTLSLNDVLSDTADNQFVADLGSSSPDTLKIDLAGGWTATTSNPTLGPTGVAAGISVSGMTARTFTNGTDTVTVFSNAEVVQAEILT